MLEKVYWTKGGELAPYKNYFITRFINIKKSISRQKDNHFLDRVDEAITIANKKYCYGSSI